MSAMSARGRRLRLGVAIVFAVTGFAFAGWATRTRTPAPLPRRAEPPVAEATPPREAAIDDDAGTWIGVLMARHSVDLATKIEGKVTEVKVRPGDRVRKGAVIATVDVRAQKKELAVLQATAGSAHARYARRATAARAAGDLAIVSPEELASARDEAHIASARAEQLRVALSDGTLRAPFDGIVASTYAEGGTYVRPGTPIMRVVSVDELRLRFAVPERGAEPPRAGMRVAVNAGDRTLAATIDNVAPEVDAAARMVFAEARVDLPAGQSVADQTALLGRVVRVSLQKP